MSNENSNDLQVTLSQALSEIKTEQGGAFDPSKVNLADLERRTGISRKRLRKLKKDGFEIRPHGNTGKNRKRTVLTDCSGTIDKNIAGRSSDHRIAVLIPSELFPE